MGGHRASCTGEQRKEILLIGYDTMLPRRMWLSCFLCLLPLSWAAVRGGCSQCQRVPEGTEQGAGSHKMNSVRLHKSFELRDVDPSAALIKAWIPR